jgi:hypothetical protein
MTRREHLTSASAFIAAGHSARRVRSQVTCPLFQSDLRLSGNFRSDALEDELTK